MDLCAGYPLPLFAFSESWGSANVPPPFSLHIFGNPSQCVFGGIGASGQNCVYYRGPHSTLELADIAHILSPWPNFSSR